MKASVDSKVKTAMTPSWDLVKPSFQLFKANIEPIIFILLLPALVSVLGSLLTGSDYFTAHHVGGVDSRQKIGLVLSGISVLWTIVNLGPSTLLQLRSVDKKTSVASDLYRQGLPFTLRVLGFYVLFILMLIIGLLLLIVPGFIVLRRYLLTPYYIVDKGLSITAAMKQSAADTKTVKGYVWGVIGVQVVFEFAAGILQLIPLVGAIVGQLVTYTILFTLALRYREIQPSAGV